jgi:hypothetical protein
MPTERILCLKPGGRPGPRLALGLGLCLALAACGGKPLADAEAALAAKDLPRAEAALTAALQAHPGLRQGHMECFVLYRYQAAQGEVGKQDAYRRRAEVEYGWLVTAYQLTENYQDMEGSIKAQPDADADFLSVHQMLYGQ